MAKHSWVDRASEKVFQWVHRNNLVYNSCWEDPRLDREALELKPADEILMITSAGCNALDYLLDEPKAIYCVDVNARQNALLDLKIAAIRHLDFELFFSIFGKGHSETFLQVYMKDLRKSLPDSSRQFWDKNWKWFTHKNKSFYFRGTSGLFARLLNFYIQAFGFKDFVLELFDARCVQDQANIYHHHIREKFFSPTLREALKTDPVLALLGIPRSQRQQIDKTFEGGIAGFIESSVSAVFAKLPLHDNYFWWLYFTGSYTQERCPQYLKAENFQKLKAGLVDRVQTKTCSLLEFLSTEAVRPSRFVLLDHMDWLSVHHRAVLQEEWQAFIDSAAPQARFLWRSGSPQVDFVDPLVIQKDNQKFYLGELLDYHRDWAATLHERDRVHTYGSFSIADLR